MDDDDGPLFDAVDEAGVPNNPEADSEAAWLAGSKMAAPPPPPVDPGVDPYDESIPIGLRAGTQSIHGGRLTPVTPPKPRRWLPGRPLGKRARQAAATAKQAPLHVVPQTPPTQPSKSRGDLREILSSIAEICGIGAISYGSWLAWHPAGFIIGGLGVVLLGVASGRNA